jgi:hypothetical protein
MTTTRIFRKIERKRNEDQKKKKTFNARSLMKCGGKKPQTELIFLLNECFKFKAQKAVSSRV